MKTYSVAMVRERLAEALDDAQAGRPVFIERRGVIYRISVEPAAKRARPAKKAIEVLDPAIEKGTWSWDWSPRGQALRLRARRRRG
jgi:antitoxin (DNA-binding transcriptional repressor) of toxin-antitoxin stability system